MNENSDEIIEDFKNEIKSIFSTTKQIFKGDKIKRGASDTIEDEKNEPKIQEYTRFVIFCMKSMAMLPIFTNRKGFIYDFINFSYCLFVDFVSFHITIFSLADVLLSWDGNVFSLTFNMIVTVIYVTNTLLLLYFQLYWKELLLLLESLDQTFRHRSAQGLTVLDMTASFKRARMLSITFTVSCVVGAVHWALMPFFTQVKDGRRILPLKIWYPIDVQKSPYYETAYALQFFGQLMTAMVYANFGILFVSECILICGQFDILCCSLRNIRYTALRCRGYSVPSLVELAGFDVSGVNRCTLPEDEFGQYQSGKPKILDPRLEKSMGMFLNPLVEDIETSLIITPKNKPNSLNRCSKLYPKIIRSVSFKKTPDEEAFINHNEIDAYEEYRVEVMEVIKDCILHHQEILEYCESFEKFCSPISLVKMIEITFLACFVMYSFSVITIFEYGTLTFWDLFMLCYFGNEVRLRSAMVAQAACSGPWHVMDEKTFKSLVPLILRASKPVHFTGGSFYMLNLENLIGVLKASFSYFTVLRNMNEAQSHS